MLNTAGHVFYLRCPNLSSTQQRQRRIADESIENGLIPVGSGRVTAGGGDAVAWESRLGVGGRIDRRLGCGFGDSWHDQSE